MMFWHDGWQLLSGFNAHWTTKNMPIECVFDHLLNKNRNEKCACNNGHDACHTLVCYSQDYCHMKFDRLLTTSERNKNESIRTIEEIRRCSWTMIVCLMALNVHARGHTMSTDWDDSRHCTFLFSFVDECLNSFRSNFVWKRKAQWNVSFSFDDFKQVKRAGHWPMLSSNEISSNVQRTKHVSE
jgi:hypothetical protein